MAFPAGLEDLVAEVRAAERRPPSRQRICMLYRKEGRIVLWLPEGYPEIRERALRLEPGLELRTSTSGWKKLSAS